METGGPPLYATRTILEWPLCDYCKKPLAHFEKALRDFPSTQVRSCCKSPHLESAIRKQSGSCSLCWWMRHLLPDDLPQSTTISIRTEYDQDRRQFVQFKLLGDEKRFLGHVGISQLDVVGHLQRTTVDFQQISRCLRECENEHFHQNWNLPRYQECTSIHLIDVEDMMIISATTQRRYLALSYVWGEQDSFAATTKTRESLSHMGGLIEYMDEIPQTIKDAMDVVRKLDERYLWVDRLCIEQDNATQKEAHIQRMDVIYSHALITIIAHAGVAATSPLPGLRPGTRLGLPTQRIGEFVISVEAPNLYDSGAPHETRGWTLQEQLMSKRCLYFDYHTTWFQCDNGVCREIDTTKDRPSVLWQTPTSCNMHSLRSFIDGDADNRGFEKVWEQYATIIERYRTRDLRYAANTVNAIRGVASIILNLMDMPLISAMAGKTRSGKYAIVCI